MGLKTEAGRVIYFVQSGHGAVKIGFSHNPAGRISSIQGIAADEVRLLGLMEGDIDVERQLHKQFADCRIRGEWFRPASELLAFIGELPKITMPPNRAVGRKPRPLTAEEVKKWRQERNLTQREAAEKLDIPLRTYQGWEAGRRKTQAAFIRQLMRRVSKPKLQD